MNTNTLEMEIFRTGDYGDKGRYTEADLDALVADYQPTMLEAPLTFDHSQRGPAYGWVAALRRAGDRLIATLRGIPEAVIQLLRDGQYKKRSVELIRSFSQTNRPYLRAVSLLGAATPAVKGLQDVQFAMASDEEIVRFEEEHTAVPELPTREQLTAEIARLHAMAEEFRRKSRLQEADGLFAELRQEGIAISHRDAAALRQLLYNDNADVVIFEEEQTSAVQWLKQFLRNVAVRVPLGEAAADAQAPDATERAVSAFSERVDPDSLALHHAALAAMKQNPALGYGAALVSAARK